MMFIGNMKLHFDLPQEDELGTSLLSGLRVSPYSSLIFMKDEMEYRKKTMFEGRRIERLENVCFHDLSDCAEGAMTNAS